VVTTGMDVWIYGGLWEVTALMRSSCTALSRHTWAQLRLAIRQSAEIDRGSVINDKKENDFLLFSERTYCFIFWEQKVLEVFRWNTVLSPFSRAFARAFEKGPRWEWGFYPRCFVVDWTLSKRLAHSLLKIKEFLDSSSLNAFRETLEIELELRCSSVAAVVWGSEREKGRFNFSWSSSNNKHVGWNLSWPQAPRMKSLQREKERNDKFENASYYLIWEN
jgi:hypothetical protein